MISGCGRSAGAVIPALGSGRYSPGPYIVLPSWLKDSDPNCTINVFWGQPGALATVSEFVQIEGQDRPRTRHLQRWPKTFLGFVEFVPVAFQYPNAALGPTRLAANLLPDSLGNRPR